MNNVILKKGREKSVRNRHPWIFSGAIAKIEGDPGPGEIVKVSNRGNEFLAYGYYNHASQISIRILEWDEKAVIDKLWWRQKIEASIRRRQAYIGDDTDAYRLVFSEADGLPGLIVDKYADYLVIQAATAGIEKMKALIAEILAELINPGGIYERSDIELRAAEALADSIGVLYGQEPVSTLVIKENGLKFVVDIKSGQKTGFYLDQRENRLKTAKYTPGLTILDCFCHTGAFSIYALQAGAKSVTLVDSSADSLEIARQNIELNGFSGNLVKIIAGDVFEKLRQFRQEGQKFDMVILDPPKFAKSQVHLKKALAAYKDINLLGLELLNPGGYLVTFSCSGAVDYATLWIVLFWAAVDSGRQLQILEDLAQGPDHPRLATFPEGAYLHGVIARVF